MYVEHDEFDREIYHLTTSDIESLDIQSLFYELMLIEVRKCNGIVIVNETYNVVYDEVSGRYGFCNTKKDSRVVYCGRNNALIGVLTQLTK